MKYPKVHIISALEWHTTKNSPLGRVFYPYRFSKGELEGVFGVCPPKVLARKNYNTNNIEFINTSDLLTKEEKV